MKLLAPLIAMFLLAGCAAGCGSNVQIAKTEMMAEVSLIRYQAQTSAAFEAIFSSYRINQQARVDQLYANAVAGHTGADGKAPVAVITALEVERLRQYAEIERSILLMRQKLVIANADAANAVSLLTVAQQYWTQQAQSTLTLQTAADTTITILEQILAKKIPAPAPTPTTKP